MVRNNQTLVHIKSVFFFKHRKRVYLSWHGELFSIRLLELQKWFVFGDVLVNLRNCETRGPLVIVILVFKLKRVCIFKVNYYSHICEFSHCFKIARLIVFSFVENNWKIITIQIRQSREISVSDEVRLYILVMILVWVMSHQNDAKSFKWNNLSVIYRLKGIFRISSQKLNKERVDLVFFFCVWCLRYFLLKLCLDF